MQANTPYRCWRRLTPRKPRRCRWPPIESQKLADGVWYVGGIRHASVAIEFRDFVAVVEAPLNEKRPIAVIDEVHRLVPNKSVRYLVNTHHHFDHAGGMRDLRRRRARPSSPIRVNREFYQKVVLLACATDAANPIALFHARILMACVIPCFELVNQKYVISDGTRTLDVYPGPRVRPRVER